MQNRPTPPRSFQPHPYNPEGARHADELASQARPSWRDKYRTPSQVNVGAADYVTVQSQVGHVWRLDQVEPGTSAARGPFVRFVGQELDGETGEVLDDPTRLVAFAQAIRRFAEQLAGGELTGLLVLNPAVVVRIASEGDVVLFVDP